MTATQALHLIEQFASQAPFAIWITDARGVAIFANRKLHEMLGIAERPSGAVGMNLFNDPSIEALGIQSLRDRLMRGETVDEIIEIKDASAVPTEVVAARTGKLVFRAIAYPLLSPAQKAEHYVIILNDATNTYLQRDKLRQQIRDVEIYKNSKDARIRKHRELEERIRILENEIRAFGAEPAG
jgi:PAS domain-containing protein